MPDGLRLGQHLIVLKKFGKTNYIKKKEINKMAKNEELKTDGVFPVGEKNDAR